MICRARRIVATICATALLVAVVLPAHATTSDMTYINSNDSAAANNSVNAAFDAFLLRPLGFGALAIGSVLFLCPVLPITLITRPTDVMKPFKILILNPAKYIWADPLGTH